MELEQIVAKRTKQLQQLNQKLVHQTQHDVLTGLPNRALFEDRLDQAIANAIRNQGKVALLFVDIDYFKSINDRHGHEAGDRVLLHRKQIKGLCEGIRYRRAICQRRIHFNNAGF